MVEFRKNILEIPSKNKQSPMIMTICPDECSQVAQHSLHAGQEIQCYYYNAGEFT